VERIWRREGLKVPQRQPKRGRLWLADGYCIRQRPEWHSHVWAYAFVQDRTQDERVFRILTAIDEFTRECLAIVVARQLNSADVLATLAELFTTRVPPAHIRFEFCTDRVRDFRGHEPRPLALRQRWRRDLYT
jgi:putative transposase